MNKKCNPKRAAREASKAMRASKAETKRTPKNGYKRGGRNARSWDGE